MRKLCKKKRQESQERFEMIQIPLYFWIIVGISFLVLMCLHTYNDILITAKQGYSFWNLLFEGRPFEFYKEARMSSGNVYFSKEQGAAYLFPVYLFFAIWNFPTWLFSRILNTELFNTIPSMIWMKMILIPFIILSARSVYKIITQIHGKEKYALLGAFLFVSSLLVIIPTALIGQYDIFALAFILMGFEGWVNCNTKKFLLSFAIAVLFKYFAFLFFLPLLFLEEKIIRKILIKFLLVAMPVVPFLLFPKPQSQSSNVNSMLDIMLGEVQIGSITIYLFPSIIIISLIACYFCRTSKENRIINAVYYLFIILGAFCVVVNTTPYWSILAAPIFVLLVFISNNANKTLILEMLLCLGITIKNFTCYYWCFGMNTVGGMGVLHRILGKEPPDTGYTFSLFYKLHDNTLFISSIFTFMFIIYILMIYFSRPRAKRELTFEPFAMKTVYIRTGINVIISLLQTAFLAAFLIFEDVIL